VGDNPWTRKYFGDRGNAKILLMQWSGMGGKGSKGAALWCKGAILPYLPVSESGIIPVLCTHPALMVGGKRCEGKKRKHRFLIGGKFCGK